MWELRLILVLIGTIIVGAIYLLSRPKRHPRQIFHREAPSLEGQDGWLDPTASRPQPAAPAQVEPAGLTMQRSRDAAEDQLMLVLHVVCRETGGFAGDRVLEALSAAGLRYGQYRVFHRLLNQDLGPPVFSVANMVEPGVLDPDQLPRMRLPGLTTFLLLPGPEDGVAACAHMLATARTLARVLDGEVLDESHHALNRHTTQRLRERIIEFQRGLTPNG